MTFMDVFSFEVLHLPNFIDYLVILMTLNLFDANDINYFSLF